MRGDVVKLFFMAGMPRSGSTLLANLLAQNPANYVTPTNGLIEHVVQYANSWTMSEGFVAQGVENVTPRIRRSLRGMIQGFYPELDAGRAVFDKSRGWLAQIRLLEDVFQERVQVVVTVRDVRDVCASFENLFQANQLTRPPVSDESRIQGATVLGRCQQYLRNDATLGMWCNWLKDAYETGLSDRLLLIPYSQLVANPIGVVALVHQSLGLDEFICDPGNVENRTPEDDFNTYGLPYHTLRPQVDGAAIGRGRSLPLDASGWIDENFPTINALAAGPVVVFGQPFEEAHDGQ
jgi:sulfotransferase